MSSLLVTNTWLHADYTGLAYVEAHVTYMCFYCNISKLLILDGHGIILRKHLGAIGNLWFSSSAVNILMNYGLVDKLFYIIRNGLVPVQEFAWKVVFRQCRTSEKATKKTGDARFMPELVKFLKSFKVRETEAEAIFIYSLVLVPKNQMRFHR